MRKEPKRPPSISLFPVTNSWRWSCWVQGHVGFWGLDWCRAFPEGQRDAHARPTPQRLPAIKKQVHTPGLGPCHALRWDRLRKLEQKHLLPQFPQRVSCCSAWRLRHLDGGPPVSQRALASHSGALVQRPEPLPISLPALLPLLQIWNAARIVHVL